MLRENKERKNSFYSTLYEKIPESHILKQIDKAVDFRFINDLLESSYCKNFGRPAKEPEMMMKLLFLQYIGETRGRFSWLHHLLEQYANELEI